VVVGLAVITVGVDEVIGLVTTVPDAGTTPLIGTVIGVEVAITGIGVVVIVLRLRNRLKSPVRVGWLATV